MQIPNPEQVVTNKFGGILTVSQGDKAQILIQVIDAVRNDLTFREIQEIMFVCPAGHMAIRRARQKKDTSNQSHTYYFDIEKCRICSVREGCYKAGAKSKTYSIPIKTDEQKSQIDFQQTDRFKEKARERYKIEAKNAELKHVYGYDKAQSYELHCIQMQGAMVIFTANIKRILKLI